MVLMTVFITLGFLIRSSSLVGWIPLAMAAIMSSKNWTSNLLAVI